ncbi:Plasmid stabilization system protein ParE [Ekhidna lutea]|uniref:Plasmid stabilization system protein ParE n=1 Tax=Ekhidna lutea TaxID=447679 RepID=A0A239K2D6_EKHLU|nr:type II toxin-antitoxin system RelE/ParE family toxin [Ekhidna lutea]SNT12235.1 Plasmid stabilization system protein ParE [Ekhidna lutea]
MGKVIWTKRAFDQLQRNIKYIKEEQGNSYAETVLNKILSSTALLEGTPKMGRVESLLEHKKSEYRFMIVWSYKIIYRVATDSVVITRVFHTSRNPDKLKGV